MKKTKIVATLGPAIDSPEKIISLLKAGVNVFRVNFSHAQPEIVKNNVALIREISEKENLPVAILGDLQGPKIRIGEMEDGVVLNNGDSFTFTQTEIKGTKDKAFVNYPFFTRDVKPSERVLLDDGKIIMEIVSTDGETGQAKVIQGGPLKSKKGINLPNTDLSLPALTDKDLVDVRLAMELELDWIALSFVRHAEDILNLKKIIEQEASFIIPVVAKIEKPEAIRNLDEIIKVSDAILVARGDLGIEVPIQEVPMIQKDIVKKARRVGRPVIIATQMMESMIEHLVPTRAEANDVANAVMDGADAVMLSGETSVGKHPVQAVEMMTNIINSVENSKGFRSIRRQTFDPNHDRFITDTVCQNACQIGIDTQAEAIISLTNSGYTGYKIASYRPGIEILVFTSNRRLLSQMCLVWGVSTFFYNKFESTDNTVNDVNEIAKEAFNLNDGDQIINLSSMPIHERGKVNTLRISTI